MNEDAKTIYVVMARDLDYRWNNIAVFDSLEETEALIAKLNLRRDSMKYSFETWQLGEILKEYKP